MAAIRTMDRSLHPEGWSTIVDLYGPEMQFHDAEILSFGLTDDGSFRMRLHCWRMTKEVDSNGYFILADHAVVSIECDGVADMRLRNSASPQHIIFSLMAERSGGGERIDWESSVGMDGYVQAEVIRFGLIKGIPSQ